MSGDLETRIKIEMKTDQIDSAINLCKSNSLFGEIGDMISEFKENVTNAAQEGLREAAEDNQDLQTMFITINKSIVKGSLIQSIVVNEESETSFTIVPEADYANIVENGRGEVHPVSARVLHWVDYGEDIFRMYSGPAQPKPFVEPAFERTDNGRAVKFIEEAISNVL